MKENEEIRSGFKVSSNRKKIWNVQLGLLSELKKICEKHNIKYYADGGTLLGVIRHAGFIPRDDDIDIVMFRDDYERFWEIAPKELPSHIKLNAFYGGFSKLENTNTAALGDDNRWDEDLIGGINLDIFPIDYASKYMVENRYRTFMILFLRAILLAQHSDRFIKRMKKRKQPFIYICKYLFDKMDGAKIYNLQTRINKHVIFKGKNVYSAGFVYRHFPKSMYDKSHLEKFEDTTINIPDGYDIYLKSAYGDYMKPVIYQGGHHRRYSIDKSYKNIIKSFDRNKSNEDNYNNCEYLFPL